MRQFRHPGLQKTTRSLKVENIFCRYCFLPIPQVYLTQRIENTMQMNELLNIQFQEHWEEKTDKSGKFQA